MPVIFQAFCRSQVTEKLLRTSGLMRSSINRTQSIFCPTGPTIFDCSVPQVTQWLNRVALASGVVRLLEENLTEDHSRPTCVEGATLHARIKKIPSVDFVRVCPYATLGPLQMAKCSAPIQLSLFPGHCSKTLFFLFPIPTSLFFINLIFSTCSRPDYACNISD